MATDKVEKATESTLPSADVEVKNEKSVDKAKKSDAKAKDSKKPNIFKRIARFFKDVKSEWKKIVWPSKKQIINNTLVVLVVMVIVAAIAWILDFLFIGGFNLLWNI